MDAKLLKDKAIEMVQNVGVGVLNSLYPNDFEYYMLSLELTYFDNFDLEKTIRFFSFPVMPNSITQTEPQINNIKKNYGGLTVLNSPTFVPKDITIQGNFGKMMRIMIGDIVYTFGAMLWDNSTWAEQMKNKKMLFNKTFSKNNNVNNSEKEFLGGFVKSGYGALKILQAMCEQSKQIDYDKPRRLYLHNPALGVSYLVKVVDLNLNQNMQSNMIWNYTLRLKAIAPLESLEDKNVLGFKKTATTIMMQQGIKAMTTVINNISPVTNIKGR